MTHAHVTAGAVGRTGDLPQAWRWPDGTTTSGFNLLPAATIKAAGWLPLIDSRPTPGVDQVLGPDTYTIGVNDVTVTAVLQAAPQDQINRRLVLAALALMITEGKAATATLDAQIAQPPVTVTTFAQAQSASRAIQLAVQDQARIQRGHILRTVQIARYVAQQFDATGVPT